MSESDILSFVGSGLGAFALGLAIGMAWGYFQRLLNHV